MSPVDLVVDVDLAVRREASMTRLRARHILRDGRVHANTSDGDGVCSRTLDVRAWRSELARLCRVAGAGQTPSAPVPEMELPWELVIGTGRALRAGRADVYAELLGRERTPVADELAMLHSATVGRLRAVGILPSRGRIGWVSWLLFPDGWRALTPCVATDHRVCRPVVRLERRQPEDLGHDVARWASTTRP